MNDSNGKFTDKYKKLIIKEQFCNSRKSAFTLAEVLITLGIIGIVASMTLPGIIANKQRKELHSQLLVGYSLLQQALERMNADFGYPPTPSDFPARTFKSAYMKYFDSPIDCGWGGVHATGASQLCGKGKKETNENGTTSEITTLYSTYNNSKKHISSAIIDDGQFALKNGMLVMIENISTAEGLFISIDVNGITKKPNIWGHDLFNFSTDG